jgi:hypothetical protein
VEGVTDLHVRAIFLIRKKTVIPDAQMHPGFLIWIDGTIVQQTSSSHKADRIDLDVNRMKGQAALNRVLDAQVNCVAKLLSIRGFQ